MELEWVTSGGFPWQRSGPPRYYPRRAASARAQIRQARLERERVQPCLGSLTRLQWEPVTPAYYGGYTFREVAALPGVPEGTVKTRVRDDLIRLRGRLGEA